MPKISSRERSAILGEVYVGGLKEGRHSGALGLDQFSGFALVVEVVRRTEPEVLVEVLVVAYTQLIHGPVDSRLAQACRGQGWSSRRGHGRPWRGSEYGSARPA